MSGLFGGGSAPEIDLRPYANALKYQADTQAELQRETMGQYREMYDRSMNLFDEVYGTQTRIAEEQWQVGKESYNRWKNVFQPQEDKYLERVEELNDPRYKQLQQARAQAEVQQAFDAQRENAMQRMSAMGVDPSQVRSGALDTNARNQMAAQQAAAANSMGLQIDQQRDAARINAVNMGKGYAGTALQGLQGAAGTYGSQTGQFAQAASAPLGYGNMAQGFGGQALSGYNMAGNMMATEGQHNLNAWTANQQYGAAGQIGSMVGTGIGVAGAMGYAEGGMVPEEGVPLGQASPQDRHPAMLADNEYVVPADVVQWKGQEFFEKLAMKSRQDKQQGIQPSGQQKQQGIPAGGQ